MRSSRSIVVVAAVLAPFALSRCDCADPLSGLPTAQIEVVDDAGNSHLQADPWLIVDMGDADSGQSKSRVLTAKDIGTGQMILSNVCLVNAVDAETAKTATCILGQNTQFAVSAPLGAVVRPGDAVDLTVSFSPTAGGPASLFVQITTTAVDEPVVAVQLVGRGTDGRLCAEPSGIYDFGDVDVGSTQPGTITVRNCGVKPVTIDAFAFGNNPDNAFTFTPQGGTNPVGATLAENDAIVLDLTFTPQNPGAYRDSRAGDIHVVTAAPFAAEYDLILIGNGVVPPACRVHVVPAVLNFNAVASGTAATRQVIVQSVGQCGCTVDAISNPDPAGAGFVLGTLPALPFVLKGTLGCAGDPAGAATAPTNLSIPVTYTSPVRDTPVVDNASMTVSTSDLANPVQDVALEANGGGAPFCQLEVNPVQTSGGFSIPVQGRWGVVDFGRTSVHVPKRQPITMKNIGNTDCTVSAVALNVAGNTTDHEFSIETDAGAPAETSSPVAIQAGDTRTYFAVFSPTHTLTADGLFGAFAFGSYSGSLGSSNGSALFCNVLSPTACNGVQFTTTDTTTDVSASNQAAGVYSIGFTGTPVAPFVDVIPGQLDFGLVTIGCGSPVQRVTAYNNGGADLQVDEPTIDPVASPALFTVEGTTNFSNTWPYTIPPGGSLSIEVRYHASATSLQTGNLVIPTVEGGNAGPPITVPLQGTGTNDTSQLDVFDQFGDPKVDVLWVVDDSGSMQPEQDQLAQNFGQFFTASNVSASQFHIAVTSTLTVSDSCIPAPPSCTQDSDCGAGGSCQFHLCTAGTPTNSCPDDPMCGYYTSCSNEHFLQPSSPTPDTQFQCNVHVSNGMNPSRPASDNAEGGFRAAYRFLSAPNVDDPAINGGFLRDDAKLHVIMVSDEPEQSKGSVDEYVDFFKNLKGFRNASLVTVSAIAAPTSGCTLPSGDALAGDARYETLVGEMNGRFQSICNPDWTGMMSQLGLDSLGLRVEFFLSRAAEEASLQVCVRATANAPCVAQTKTSDGAANGFFFDPVANSVVFNPASVPPRFSRIEVQYGTVCF